jgi:hypothetical protein
LFGLAETGVVIRATSARARSGDESGDQAGPGDGSAFVGATGDLEASVHAVDCRAGPVPEICQNLRNA